MLEDIIRERKKKKENLEIDYVYICSRLGTDNKKIICIKLSDNLYEGVKQIEEPFCFVIPAKTHFIEKEFMEKLIRF